MKHLKLLSVLFLALVIPMAGCDDDNGNDDVDVKFATLTADGSESATTTKLTLTFDAAISGLAIGDISIEAGTTGAVADELASKGDGVYELTLKNIIKSGEITVTVKKDGYNISSASKTATVWYVAPAVPRTFDNLTADGSTSATTTKLTLTFNGDIDGLTEDDITIDPAGTGVTKGELSRTDEGIYDLTVSGITEGGDITLTVEKAGYEISPESKQITVYLKSGYDIGDTGPAGGIIFYKKAEASEGWQYMEVAPAGWDGDPDDPSKQWGEEGSINLALKIGSGKNNTSVLADAFPGTQYAAVYCGTYNGGGQSDWFIPSKDELTALYDNLTPLGVGGFAREIYLSSSGVSWSQTSVLNFADGAVANPNKTTVARIRPVRMF